MKKKACCTVMTEKTDKTSGKVLNAEGLLKNRGIRHEVWGEWEKTLRVLPKTGEKQFEPNNSWLQNKQIDKGLTNRKDLLNIQRVERNSQLATAIWLEHEKKAQVIKKSGQDWSCFGTETKSRLLLTPEEALILLELNCLELTWDNVALSVQQAFEILIEEDESQCTIDEYRVYSHLVRQGYRVQRYCQDIFTSSVSGYVKWVRMTRNAHKRKKFIVNPINGLRMSDGDSEKNVKEKEKKDISISMVDLVNDIKSLIDDMINKIEKRETELPKVEETLQNNESSLSKLAEANAISDTQHEECYIQELPGPSNVHQAKSPNNNGKRTKPKIGIISEETVLEPVRLIKCSPGDTAIYGNSAQKWSGSRIQRNVKLLPKRNDKTNLTISEESQDISMVHDSEPLNSSRCSPQKRKVCPVTSVLLQNKKSKHEVIELSNDEIEEIPHSMSRMEMLNFLPNIASESIITEKISRRYLPQNVRPQNNTYQYVRWKMYNIQEADKRIRMGFQRGRTETEATNDVENQNNTIIQTNIPGNAMSTYSNQNQNQEQGFRCLISAVMNVARSILPEYMQQPNTHLQRHRVLPYMNRMPSYQAQRYSMPTRYFQENIINNPVHVVRHLRSHLYGYSRYPSSPEHHRPFSMVHRNYNLGTSTAQSYVHPAMWNNSLQQYHSSSTIPSLFQNGMFLCQQSSQHQATSVRTYRNRQYNHGTKVTTSKTGLKDDRNGRNHFDNNEDNSNQSSFVKLPGVSSWMELKKKWIDEKTIIIDDEERNDTQDEVDCSEVQVINETTKPLVNPKNVGSIPEVYEKLQIIKSASEKNVRRRRCDYKISYNVYSSTQPFKKSNPGVPICRMVVTSKRDDPIIQPAELIQLQVDGEDAPIIVAYVSGSSISFTQCGVVSIPNLISD